jgi:hypothetical protein
VKKSNENVTTEADKSAETDDSIVTTPSRIAPERQIDKFIHEAKKALKADYKAGRAAERLAARPPRPISRRPLPTDRIARTHSVAADLTLTIPDSESPDTWLDPAFLKNVIGQVNVGSKITLRNDSFTYVMQAFVVMVEPAIDKIVCRVWQEAPLEPVLHEDQIMGGYQAAYLGLHDQWGVIRVTDSATMLKNLPSKREAIYRITNELALRPVA